MPGWAACCCTCCTCCLLSVVCCLLSAACCLLLCLAGWPCLGSCTTELWRLPCPPHRNTMIRSHCTMAHPPPHPVTPSMEWDYEITNNDVKENNFIEIYFKSRVEVKEEKRGRRKLWNNIIFSKYWCKPLVNTNFCWPECRAKQ